MPKPFIGVRWWLGVAFAVVAATSTAIVVSQFSNNSENAFRHNGEIQALRAAMVASRVTPASFGRIENRLNEIGRAHV